MKTEIKACAEKWVVSDKSYYTFLKLELRFKVLPCALACKCTQEGHAWNPLDSLPTGMQLDSTYLLAELVQPSGVLNFCLIHRLHFLHSIEILLDLPREQAIND